MHDSEPSPSQDPTADKNDVAPDSPKTKREILVVPHEDDMIAQEMAELFEEDEVTHQHGSTEPEGD